MSAIFLLTFRLNRTIVRLYMYVAEMIKHCLIKKVPLSSYWAVRQLKV